MRIELTDDIETCRALRRAVFIEEQGVSEAEEWDGHDGEAMHLLCWRGYSPVGTARVLVHGHTGKIGRVCVLAAARGEGVGAALMHAALDLLRELPGVREVELGAQIHALRFYEKLGFVAFGPDYMDAGIPHRHMRLEL